MDATLHFQNSSLLLVYTRIFLLWTACEFLVCFPFYFSVPVTLPLGRLACQSTSYKLFSQIYIYVYFAVHLFCVLVMYPGILFILPYRFDVQVYFDKPEVPVTKKVAES